MGRNRVFVFKLWVYLEVALEESIIAFLQILWQRMIQRLQFESIFLWLLQRSSSRWLVVGTLLDVQGELLGHLLVINNLLLVL